MKRSQWVWIIIIALLLGGVGGILINKFGIPYLARIKGLSWLQKLESNSPVVINRYQEVQYNEGTNLIDLSRQAAAYTVSIYSQAPNSKFLANGIITSSDGMIITSRVSLPSDGIVVVVLNDGTTYPGTLRALDSRSELAVITINAKNLSFAQFADASGLQASQRLIFLGRSNNSFVHDFAQGQVLRTLNNQQSLERVFNSDSFENAIKVQTQLTPEFIGGPVVDFEGKVVGMTNSALGVLIGENLQSGVTLYLQTGKLLRPSFGIKYLNLSDAMAKLKALPGGGAEVVSVDPGSPAQKAGIAINDLIVSIDGQDLPSGNFEKALNQHAISAVPVTVIRSGQKIDLTVTLEAK